LKYGFFDDLRREYVITRPDTPLPWINYLGSDDFFGLISNTAGGYCFYRDARLRRLTRYRYNNVPLDLGGRYIYLRDDASGQFWSPTWQPTRSDLSDYECRHGLGYTSIRSAQSDISATITYLVPPQETMELWRLTVRNHRSEAAALSVFSVVEFALWDAWDDATNYQRNFNTGEVEVDGGVIYHKTEYRERRDHFAYFACSEKLAGFDTQREAFLGPYRGWDNPACVEAGRSGNSIAHGWAPIGSHHVTLNIKPGEQREIVFLLGYHENPRDRKFTTEAETEIDKSRVLPVIRRYLEPGAASSALERLRTAWDDVLGGFQIETPDQHTNRMVNVWNAYQNMVTFNLSRSASYFESGIGRGMGFRDSNQDLLGFVHMVPEKARDRLLDLAATQLETGGAYHQYQPLTKRGNDAIGGDFNDDPLWLVLAVGAYVKETGDHEILDVPVPFENREGSDAPLYEHLRRSMRYTLDRLGPNGLPLIGRADWNDCLNLNTFSDAPGESFQTTTNQDGRVAESVFIAGLFVLATKEMIGLTRVSGRDDQVADFEREANAMAETVEARGWDGSWFLRAYDHYGDRVGSSTCEEGQIFIEPQGMCVMAGIGLEDGRARRALDAVADRLATPHGILLHQPAYSRYYLHLGEISSYPPGYKENAGIFCHTNPWIMIAEALAGRGDRAFDYYLRINPSAREDLSDVHRCEPYVYAQMIAGTDAATHGEAKNSWLTGTAAWNYVAITQWILGIRPSWNGLEIAPVLPPDWPGFRAERRYRGVRYRIEVRRDGPGNRVTLTADGIPLHGTVVPIPGDGRTAVDVLAVIS
jgi:cellobiose phosphorylase